MKIQLRCSFVLVACIVACTPTAENSVVADARGGNQGPEVQTQTDEADQKTSFFPIAGVVPPGQVEAQNTVVVDGATEYRQLIQIDESSAYVSALSAGAQGAGFLTEQAGPERYIFTRDDQRIELTLRASNETGASPKAHVVWRFASTGHGTARDP